MFLTLVVLVFLCFSFVVFVGAPYLPSKRHQVEVALDLLEVGEGKVIIDFGSGDGAFLKAAAAKGAVVYGYELNPLLCAISWLRCVRYRHRVHIRCINMWKAQLPAGTDGVYTFLLPRYMKRFDQKMESEAVRLKHGFALASFTFAIPHKKADDVRDGVFLYRYPLAKH